MIKGIHHTEIDIEIPFHDIDMMEFIWHGNYAKYFEIARCALREKINYNYPQMRDSGYSWPVIDIRIRYIKPAVFMQIITVKCCCVEWENRLKIAYLIVDKQTGSRLTKGYGIQVAVDRQTQEMRLTSPTILFEKLGVMVL